MSVFRIQSIDAELLNEERRRLLRQLAMLAPDAEVLEVGSTAVEGVIGKGDLDILVRVPEGSFERTRDTLDKVLRRNEEQLSSDIYQGYHLDSPLDAAVQLTVKGGPHDDFARFLQALRADAALVARYNALKRQWSGEPMSAYREAKAAFIESVLAGLEG